jgi:ArsR family transcriptional regulator
MAGKKNGSYSGEDITVARLAKALGHPARVAILRHLASVSSCCFNEISKELPIADSTVSQHMSDLKDAGLVESYKELPRVKYSINRKNWKQTRQVLGGFVKIKIAKD